MQGPGGQGHLASLTDLPTEYGMQPNPTYLSHLPYGYLYPEKQQYLAHYPPGPPQCYSSHMYIPGSYLPMHYLNGNLYPCTKYLPTSSSSAYHHHQPRRNHHSYDSYNTMRLYSAEQADKSSKCKGHLLVLAIILTVITIGVIMGIILAVTIN